MPARVQQWRRTECCHRHVFACPVLALSPGKSPKSSCPYQCASSPLAAYSGRVLHDSSTEVAVICQDFSKIRWPRRPVGERQRGKICCPPRYGGWGLARSYALRQPEMRAAQYTKPANLKLVFKDSCGGVILGSVGCHMLVVTLQAFTEIGG